MLGAMAVARKKVGDILLEMGAIDALQLKSALAHADQWGLLIGRALVEKRFCSESDVTRALSLQTGLPILDLDTQVLDPAHASLIPAKVAEKQRVVPIRLEGKRNEILVVGLAGSASMDVLDEVRTVSRKGRVTAFVVGDGAMDRALAFLYDGKPREVVVPPQVALPPPTGGPVRGDFSLSQEPPTLKAARLAQVWLLGWHDAREKALRQMLKLAQVEASALADEALERCTEGDVILSSTLALQALLPAGDKLKRGHLIICGLAEDVDITDAKGLGAKMYLRPPFSPEQLARAIRSLQGG